MSVQTDGFTIDTSAWDTAVADIARRLPGVTRDEVLRREVEIVSKKLIQFEYRAKGPKIAKDLKQRLVLLWDSGNEYNVPKNDVAMFRRIPRAAQRRFRERKKGGKLIAPKEVADYKKRAGYLASGWGAGAQHFGVSVPGFVSRHDLSKTGSVTDNLNHSTPHVILTNKANPGSGSKHKLEATLRVQARSMQRQMEKSVEQLLARVRPPNR